MQIKVPENNFITQIRYFDYVYFLINTDSDRTQQWTMYKLQNTKILKIQNAYKIHSKLIR